MTPEKGIAGRVLALDSLLQNRPMRDGCGAMVMPRHGTLTLSTESLWPIPTEGMDDAIPLWNATLSRPCVFSVSYLNREDSCWLVHHSLTILPLLFQSSLSLGAAGLTLKSRLRIPKLFWSLRDFDLSGLCP